LIVGGVPVCPELFNNCGVQNSKNNNKQCEGRCNHETWRNRRIWKKCWKSKDGTRRICNSGFAQKSGSVISTVPVTEIVGPAPPTDVTLGRRLPERWFWRHMYLLLTGWDSTNDALSPVCILAHLSVQGCHLPRGCWKTTIRPTWRDCPFHSRWQHGITSSSKSRENYNRLFWTAPYLPLVMGSYWRMCMARSLRIYRP